MKSHFTFSKQQRNGIFLLLFLIVVFQCIYFFADFPSEDIKVNQEELASFTAEIDSLKQVQTEAGKPKIYPFNPNYITDYKGSTLGMSSEEIDRLLAYREQDQWINSAQQFQEITQISDSLLEAISPYFKFPEWVTQPKKTSFASNKYVEKTIAFSEKQDLNKATPAQLQTVNGVGEVLSQRIVKFRNKHKGGFVSDIQLQDVYGLTPEVIKNITNTFTVKTPSLVKKVDLNAATINELVTVPHIDYDLAYQIIEQRKLHDGFKSINELEKVKDFPVNKIDIIELYLHLEKKIDE